MPAEELALTDIREFLWSKYIDLEDVDTDFKLVDCLHTFKEYYEETPLESDKESFYYGILLFELGWDNEDLREEYFYKAYKIFNLYRELSGEMDWEPVEDRMEDILGQFETDGIELETLEEKYGEVRTEPPEITRLRDACPSGMTLVPGGEYAVGPDGALQHLEPFYIDILPVTNDVFRRFIDDTHYRTPKYWEDSGFNSPDKPVVGVSFFDAVKFAQWAGKELPTVEQWTAASKGDEALAYPWGNDFNGEIVSFKGTNESQQLLPAGSFPENISPSGCLDLAGNVWEWTTSWHDEDKQFRIIKGGSFADPPELLLNDAVLWASSKEKVDILGFRCTKPCKGIR